MQEKCMIWHLGFFERLLADNLWVLEKNVKAIRFYERHGFFATGEKKLEDGTSEYLILMRRKVL